MIFKVWYHPMCPYSRTVIAVMEEKGLACQKVLHEYWRRDADFLRINPAGSLPLLLAGDTIAICGFYSVLEYLEDLEISPALLLGSPANRAHIRYIVHWFNVKFYNEVSRHILTEKMVKFSSGQGSPESGIIIAAKKNILYHLDYLASLLQTGDLYLIGDKLSMADIAACAHLSVIDYFGDVPWGYVKPEVKDWYALLKSRPSFRGIFAYRLAGMRPPAYYSNPDLVGD